MQRHVQVTALDQKTQAFLSGLRINQYSKNRSNPVPGAIPIASLLCQDPETMKIRQWETMPLRQRRHFSFRKQR